MVSARPEHPRPGGIRRPYWGATWPQTGTFIEILNYRIRKILCQGWNGTVVEKFYCSGTFSILDFFKFLFTLPSFYTLSSHFSSFSSPCTTHIAFTPELLKLSITTLGDYRL